MLRITAIYISMHLCYKYLFSVDSTINEPSLSFKGIVETFIINFRNIKLYTI